MENPKVPFADTTARRAQLIAATERLKTSISDSVDSIKDDAAEVGKTTLFVAGVSLAVYLVVNAILPKSAEYRYAEKYGEPDEDGQERRDDDRGPGRTPGEQIKQQAKKTQKTAAASGLIGGLITTVLTNIAREQLTGFLARIRQNNAINPTAHPTQHRSTATH